MAAYVAIVLLAVARLKALPHSEPHLKAEVAIVLLAVARLKASM
jgi:hypothetical protein